MTVKIPCELVVWQILPTIRREVAFELVTTHKMPQSVVAKKFGVTDAAVSQYMKKKRGGNTVIENSQYHARFREEISKTAERMATQDADFQSEICRICGVAKEIGLLAEVYEACTGEKLSAIPCQKVYIQQ